MSTYIWKNTKKPTPEAQAVGEALESLRDENGALEAPIIVEAARPEDSALHKYFEWEDSTAAEKYREVQARQLMRAVCTIIAQPNREAVIVRAFVTASESGQGPYYSTVHAIQDSELRRKMLERALVELKAFQRRYREFNELAEVLNAIDSFTRSAAA